MNMFMKTLTGIVLILFFMIGVSSAADKAIPQEVVQKVKEAVALIKEKGAEAAFPMQANVGGLCLAQV